MSNTEFSFEEAYARLEAILDQMNENSIALEKSLTLYEEADKLIALCTGKLSQAEQRIETLIKNRSGELALDAQESPLREEFKCRS